MPQIPTYEATKVLRTAPAPFADAESFSGHAAAAGTRAIAGALGQAAGALKIRADEDASIWVDNTATAAKIQWTEYVERMKVSPEAGQTGFADRMTREYQAFHDEQLKGAPTYDASKALNHHLNSLGANVMGDSTVFEAGQRLAARQTALAKGIDMDSTLANRVGGFQGNEDPLGTIKAMAEQSANKVDRITGLTPSQRQTLKDSSKEILANGIRGIGDRDPNEFLKLYSEGKLDGTMDGTRLVAMAEHYRNQAQQVDAMAVDQASKDMDNALAYTQKNGVPPKGFDIATTAAIFGPKKAPVVMRKFNSELRVEQTAFVARNAMVGRSPTERQAIVEGTNPANFGANTGLSKGTVDYIKNAEGFTDVAKQDGGQISGGYGTRAKAMGEVLTKEEADVRLKEELTTHHARVTDAAKAKGYDLNANQVAALTSFDFNTGQGVQAINKSSNISDLKARMASYPATVNGKPSPGLVNRRMADVGLFEKETGIDPDYKEMAIVHDKLVIEEAKFTERLMKDPGQAGLADRGIQQMYANAGKLFSSAAAAPNQGAKDAMMAAGQRAMGQAVQANLVFQSRVGVPDFMQQAVSNADAHGYAEAIRNSKPDAVRQEFTKLRDMFGTHYGSVLASMQHLKEKPLEQIYSVIGENLDDPVIPNELTSALKANMELKGEGGLMGVVFKKDEDKKAMMEKVYSDDTMEKFRVALSTSSGISSTPYYKSREDAVAMLAANYMYKDSSMKSGKAVAKAVDDLVGRHFFFEEFNGQSYMIPKKDASGQPYTEANIFLSRDANMGVGTGQRNLIKYNLAGWAQRVADMGDTLDTDQVSGAPSHLEKRIVHKALQDSVRETGFWVNTPDMSGVALYRSVTDAKGRAVGQVPVLVRSGEPDANGKYNLVPFTRTFEKLSTQSFEPHYYDR